MKKHKSKKIYVTGHNGMVGRSVCNQLRKKNFEKIITINKKKLDLENKSDVSNFFKKKKTRHSNSLCRNGWGNSI